MPTLGDVIREARRTKGWTQEKLAEAIGVNPGYIGQIETGVVKLPGADKLEMLERSLGVSRANMLRAAGLLGPDEHIDVLAELRRIDALPNDESKIQALRQLPQEVQHALEVLAREALRFAFHQVFQK
jgi:transcriptional regulator with XRE-family HTH domain